MASVVDRIREHSGAFSASPAIIQGDRTFTHADLWDRVDRLSAALRASGLRKGDAVLAFLGNVHEAIELELAVLQSGLVWITLTARLTWAEVRGVLVSCRPKLIVTSEEGHAKIERGQGELPLSSMPPLLVIGRAFEELLAAHAPERPTILVDEEDTARLRYTSGTTGSAKAAVLPHRVFHASLDNLLDLLGRAGPVTAADRALHVAPLTHGSGALVHPILYAGGAHVLLPHFDVEQVLSCIEQHRVTAMFTVPTMLSRLVTFSGWDRFDLISMRALIYGGAPMPEAQLRVAVSKIGRALVHIYGMTEAPWPIAWLGPSEHRLDNPRLRAVGRPSVACRVRIVPMTGGVGTALPAGTVGEIQVQGRNVMRGYYENEQATRAVLSEDGWLSTGDLGRMDEDGVITIVGRKKDVIISGGFNVYPEEVEAALSSHPGVLEAAVVGLPHDDWGEMVVAFVVPRPGATLTPEELDGTARRLLSGYKCPRRIQIVPDLPKNPSGKIQKSELTGAKAPRAH